MIAVLRIYPSFPNPSNPSTELAVSAIIIKYISLKCLLWENHDGYQTQVPLSLITIRNILFSFHFFLLLYNFSPKVCYGTCIKWTFTDRNCGVSNRFPDMLTWLPVPIAVTAFPCYLNVIFKLLLLRPPESPRYCFIWSP